MRVAATSAPIPIMLLVASFLCPTEFSLEVAGLRLPPHRFALLLAFGFALFRLLSGRDIRIKAFDVVFAVFAAWNVYVFSYHEGYPAGTIYGGSLALESFGAYLVARAYIRDVHSLLASIKVLTIAIVLAALIALPETLFGRLFVHDFLHSLTGYYHPVAVQTRLGLTRAYGTFDHPIHYGTFCAALLALFWFSAVQRASRMKRGALLFGATALGLSSAPILCLGLQSAMIVWERVTRGIHSRVVLTLAAIIGLYVGASFFTTRSPIAILATGLTLDSWTGFYRLQIWEHGFKNVLDHPWLGLGLADWERPWWMVSSTVDSFWLVVMMREGIPALVILLLAIVLLGWSVNANRLRHGDRFVARVATGWMMSLIALCMIGVTVHYWNVLHAFFFFFIGTGAWIADPKRCSAMGSRADARVRQVGWQKRPARRAGQMAAPQPLPVMPRRAAGGSTCAAMPSFRPGIRTVPAR